VHSPKSQHDKMNEDSSGNHRKQKDNRGKDERLTHGAYDPNPPPPRALPLERSGS
jgi:hypothetical protein